MSAITERPVLTLHHGDAEASEHPMETARRALREAANVESGEWRRVLLQFASALPRRERIIDAGR